MITYDKLRTLLKERDIKQKEMIQSCSIASRTMNSIVHNRALSTETIDKICDWLDVQPGDIMEFVREENYATSQAKYEEAKRNAEIRELEAKLKKLKSEN